MGLYDRDAMMRVGFGATAWGRGLSGHQLDGIGYYTQEVFRRLDQQAQVQMRPVVFGAGSALPTGAPLPQGKYKLPAASLRGSWFL